MTDFDAMTNALISCDADKLTDLVNQALAADVSASNILNNGLIAGMDIVDDQVIAKRTVDAETGEIRLYCPRNNVSRRCLNRIMRHFCTRPKCLIRFYPRRITWLEIGFR